MSRPGPSDPKPEPKMYPPTPAQERRINLDAIPQPLKPHKVTYSFTLNEINRMLARQLGVAENMADINWHITEQRDAMDRVSYGHEITSVDVTIKQ